MPNTTTYSFGDVVLVPFPFTDQTATKKRPSVVISSAAYNTARPDVILMIIRTLGQLKQEDLVTLKEALRLMVG